MGQARTADGAGRRRRGRRRRTEGPGPHGRAHPRAEDGHPGVAVGVQRADGVVRNYRAEQGFQNDIGKLLHPMLYRKKVADVDEYRKGKLELVEGAPQVIRYSRRPP